MVASDVRAVFVESVATGEVMDLTKPQLRLFQNQPNPFVGETTIGFVFRKRAMHNSESWM